MSWNRWILRHLSSRPARTVVSVLAVVIGVAVFVGVSLGTRTVIETIQGTPFASASGNDSAAPLVAGDAGQDSVDFFESIEAGLAPLAGMSLLVSGFIIYLTMSRTVGDRFVAFGTIRAMGARRRTVVATVLGEAIVLGVVGTAVGVGLGHAIGPAIGAVLADGFGVRVGSAQDTGVTLTGAQWVAAVAGGVLVPPLAAGLPARRASRIEPAIAMGHIRDDASIPWVRGVAGLAALVVGATWASVAPKEATTLGLLVAMIGLLVGVPVVVAPLVGVVRRATSGLRPGISDLAAAQVARRRGRMAVTVGLVTGTLSLVILVQTMASSQRPAFVDAVDTTLGSDAELFLGPLFDDRVIDRVAARPEVAAVTPLWRGRVDVVGPRATRENLTIIDPATYFTVAGFTWTGGTDAGHAVDSLRAGGAALVSTNVADAAGVAVGDTITLDTMSGQIDFTVAGTYYGFAYGTTDAVVVGVDDGRRYFGAAAPESALIDISDGTVDDVLVSPAFLDAVRSDGQGRTVGGGVVSGASPGAVGAISGLGFPTAVIRAAIIEQFDGIYGLISVLVVLVAVLGLAGMANTLAMEVLDRRHEFGVLRALGLQRRQVWRLVITEGALLGAVAATCAVASGFVLGSTVVDTGEGGIEALDIPVRFPAGAAVALVVGAVVIGGLVSAIPGRAASRVSPTELLRTTD